MAFINVEKLEDAGLTFSQLPIKNQLMILIALAISVSIGVVSVLWVKQPNMSSLYMSLNPKDLDEVVNMLQKNNFKYKYDSYGLAVATDELHNVKMKIASMGLPKGESSGYELFDKPQGLGASQFSETVKFKRSLEGELSKTIMSLSEVKSSRVHIGIPRQNAFLQKNAVGSASVMVELYHGVTLDRNQISGILHLVASSVPGMKKENVSLVDQHGTLLSRGANDKINVASEELSFARDKEKQLAKKIESLVEPLIGKNGVKAEVTAEFDFSFLEKTTEQFDNNKKSVRNESIVTEQKAKGDISGGIPGALSNQAPNQAEPQKANEGEEGNLAVNIIKDNAAESPVNYLDKTKRQYELDRSISYKKESSGKLTKLSAAVIIDEKKIIDEKGNITRAKVTDEELKKIEGLIKDAIGFDSDRGDKISVIHSAFSEKAPEMIPNTEVAPESEIVKFMKSDLAYKLYKNSLGISIILVVLFWILRPMVRSLSGIRKQVLEQGIAKLELENNTEQLSLPEPTDFINERSEYIKKVAKDDSKRAAQVIMNWVENDRK